MSLSESSRSSKAGRETRVGDTAGGGETVAMGFWFGGDRW